MNFFRFKFSSKHYSTEVSIGSLATVVITLAVVAIILIWTGQARSILPIVHSGKSATSYGSDCVKVK